jgi:hypothetical protein
MIKRNEKFKYIEGKQLTDHETGTRVYEVVGTKLPSVTTILGATKDQEFLKKWKEKVGEKRQKRLKIYLVDVGLLCINILECYIEGVKAMMI